MVCLGIELGLITIPRRSSLTSPSVNSAVSGGIVPIHGRGPSVLRGRPLSISPNDTNTPRPKSLWPDMIKLFFTQSSVRSGCQCHTIWLYRSFRLAPHHLPSHSASLSCKRMDRRIQHAASPGPAESEDHHIADGPRPLPLFSFLHRSSIYGPMVMNRQNPAFIRSNIVVGGETK
jgi:hypothetical protein